jgi:very-short-patch-repair endonuclease
VLVEGELVDFHWPEHRLIVEVDGYRFHRTKRSFDDDRRRDTKLQVAGQRVVRITHTRITHARPALEADLRALLDAKPRRRSA